MSPDRPALRIGEVSRRTGVGVPTLRAWERRYGLLSPARTDGGHRLYRERDVAHVRAMQRLLDDGWSAGAAARQVLREPPAATGPVAPEPTAADREAAAVLVTRLEDAIDAFDAGAADEALDDVLARLEVPRALDEVVLPVLRRVGDGWEDDPRVIAREHFATNTLRPRLQRLLRTSGRRGTRTLLAAAPEHEEHDLGLLAGAVVAAGAGWGVHYLGPRTPVEAMQRAVADLRPDVVLIGAVSRDPAEAWLAAAPDFGVAAVVLGGEGFTTDDVGRIPNALRHTGSIRDLADVLERALTLAGASE